MNDRKGAFTAPFLFLGLALAAWGSAHASTLLWAAAAASLAIAWLISGRIGPGITSLAVGVWAYSCWVIVNTAFITPMYNPAGLFDPIFLLVGFSVGRVLDREARQTAYAGIGLGAGILALWGVGQLAFGWLRGQAHFETPNTLAAVLDLALAPAIVLVLSGMRAKWLNVLTVLLLAGFISTFSRAAPAALVIGVLVAMRWTLPGRLASSIKRLALQVSGAALLVAVAVVLRGSLPRLVPITTAHPDTPPARVLDLAIGSLSSRVELYELAWSRASEHLVSGIGYLGFRMVMEQDRASVPSYGTEDATYFVHNDYLQTLLELGAPGLFALLLIIFLALRIVLRPPANGSVNGRELAAVGAAVVTTAVHALVDFPLHVPICLLIFGACLGILDRLTAPAAQLLPRWSQPAGRVAQIALGAVILVLLGRPAVAEAAATYAIHESKYGRNHAAATGFELARRMDPRDSRYHFYAGQFWYAQAEVTGKAQAAKLADDAFAAGIAANPFDTRNRLARVATQIRFGSLLASPANSVTLRAWADAALAVAPANPRVRAAYEELVHQMGGKP